MSGRENTLIHITAAVTALVEHGETETLDDLKERAVDIYLHGPSSGELPHIHAIDLGADTWAIETENDKLDRIAKEEEGLKRLKDALIDALTQCLEYAADNEWVVANGRSYRIHDMLAELSRDGEG